MLMLDEVKLQNNCKAKLLEAIPQLLKHYRGPFYCGENITTADIIMAPFFDRMCVLKYYRFFEIPKYHKY
jgi:glutathione S-transferase